MARVAGASTSPSASTGKGSAGGNSRISGRGTSSFNSSLDSRRSSAAKQQIVKIATTRRQSNPHAPTFGQPSLGGVARGALANARYIVVCDNHHAGDLRRQHESTN